MKEPKLKLFSEKKLFWEKRKRKLILKNLHIGTGDFVGKMNTKVKTINTGECYTSLQYLWSNCNFEKSKKTHRPHD